MRIPNAPMKSKFKRDRPLTQNIYRNIWGKFQIDSTNIIICKKLTNKIKFAYQQTDGGIQFDLDPKMKNEIRSLDQVKKIIRNNELDMPSPQAKRASRF